MRSKKQERAVTPNQNDPKDPLGVLGRIINVSEAVDNLAMSALLGTMGGSFVIGCNTSGIFWVPFGIVAPIVVYRILVELSKRREVPRKPETQIDNMKQIQILVELLDSDLPDGNKTDLIRTLIGSSEQQPIDRKHLSESEAGLKLESPKETNDLDSI